MDYGNGGQFLLFYFGLYGKFKALNTNSSERLRTMIRNVGITCLITIIVFMS